MTGFVIAVGGRLAGGIGFLDNAVHAVVGVLADFAKRIGNRDQIAVGIIRISGMLALFVCDLAHIAELVIRDFRHFTLGVSDRCDSIQHVVSVGSGCAGRSDHIGKIAVGIVGVGGDISRRIDHLRDAVHHIIGVLGNPAAVVLL